MDSFDTPPRSGGCGIILLGVVVGAILGGVLLCVAVDVAADWEQQAMKQEIRDRVSKGEDEGEAEIHVIMEHKRMPIAAAIGFFMELGVAAVLGGSIGGVSAAAWSRRSAREVPKDMMP